jgi:hypothetical protein
MIFCASPALIALNAGEAWFENAVALCDLIEHGDVIVVYRDDLFCGFLNNTTGPSMLATTKA